jgi:2-hydroxychromene-2-carboxylate isomerase
MIMAHSIAVYSGCKRPYAFLAKDRVHCLARQPWAAMDWRPCVLDVAVLAGILVLADIGLAAGRPP